MDAAAQLRSYTVYYCDGNAVYAGAVCSRWGSSSATVMSTRPPTISSTCDGRVIFAGGICSGRLVSRWVTYSD